MKDYLRGTTLFDKLLGKEQPAPPMPPEGKVLWTNIKVIGAVFSINHQQTKSDLPLPKGYKLYTYQVKFGKSNVYSWVFASPLTQELGQLPMHALISLAYDYKDFRDCVNIDEYIISKQLDYKSQRAARQWMRCKEAFKFFQDGMRIAPPYVETLVNALLNAEYTKTETWK